jgi:hypothetical protein
MIRGRCMGGGSTSFMASAKYPHDHSKVILRVNLDKKDRVRYSTSEKI